MKNPFKFVLIICFLLILPSQAFAISIGLLNADSGAKFLVKDQLVATGHFDPADITNLSQETSNLSDYDAILAWSNYSWTDPTGVGNALADYVDNGGGLVLATFNFSTTISIGGRILDTGYSPFQPVVNGTGEPFSGVLDMSSVSHPIFYGLSSVNYGKNHNYTDPILNGIELAVDYPYGNSVIAINTNEIVNNIIGINIYPGYMDLGTNVNELFARALIHTTVPEPSSILLICTGFLVITGYRLKRRKR